MKKIVAIYFLFACSCLYAQTYHPFPTHDAWWSEEAAYPQGGPGGNFSMHHDGLLFGLSTDTTFNNKHYINIAYWHSYFYDEVWSNSYGFNVPLNVAGYKIGCLREDSSKKVWAIRYTNSYVDGMTSYFNSLPEDSELLIYDFNLSLGTYFGNYQVTNKDSVQLLDGSYRRRFIFDNGDEWIEGIGSFEGLFDGGGYPYYWLNCFSHDSVTLF